MARLPIFNFSMRFERASKNLGAGTQYDQWFDDVDAKKTTLISTLLKD
jgi:hypothetical protein